MRMKLYMDIIAGGYGLYMDIFRFLNSQLGWTKYEIIERCSFVHLSAKKSTLFCLVNGQSFWYLHENFLYMQEIPEYYAYNPLARMLKIVNVFVHFIAMQRLHYSFIYLPIFFYYIMKTRFFHPEYFCKYVCNLNNVFISVHFSKE